MKLLLELFEKHKDENIEFQPPKEVGKDRPPRIKAKLQMRGDKLTIVWGDDSFETPQAFTLAVAESLGHNNVVAFQYGMKRYIPDNNLAFYYKPSDSNEFKQLKDLIPQRTAGRSLSSSC